MEEKDVDVKLANGVLTIRGEKRDERRKEQELLCAHLCGLAALSGRLA
jgi:HSP20 family molecular chaperone IbpA